jgi:hypothetical protein
MLHLPFVLMPMVFQHYELGIPRGIAPELLQFETLHEDLESCCWFCAFDFPGTSPSLRAAFYEEPF